jgi:UDPglucose 6-dehydrogenase
MRIAVFGMGYVGLVSAAGLASWGHEVIGVEVARARLEALRAGRLPIYEPGLSSLVASGVAEGHLRFASELKPGQGVDIAIIAVGTHDGDGGWQTHTIESCLSAIVPNLDDGAAIVIRSTLPPSFLPALRSLVAAKRAATGRGPVPLMVNPEFTKEGTAVSDFLHPDRIVVGQIDDPTGVGAGCVREMYRTIPETTPFLVMAGEDAVLAKLGANLFLATKISFANELALLCEAYGADVTSVVGAMGHDDRIGPKFLKAGIGFGGSCLPHQVTMTVREAQLDGRSTPLFAAVESINDQRRLDFVDRLRDAAGGTLEGRTDALLGLTFKPNTDDLREAPSLTIAEAAMAAGARVVAYDPMAPARIRAASLLPGLEIVDSVEDALRDADVAGLVTEWPEFLGLDWAEVAELMRNPAVVDGRNALDPDAVTSAGLSYIGFGRQVGRVAATTTRPAVAGQWNDQLEWASAAAD